MILLHARYKYNKDFILFNIVLQFFICLYGMGRLRQHLTDILLLFVLCFMFVYVCYTCLLLFVFICYTLSVIGHLATDSAR